MNRLFVRGLVVAAVAAFAAELGACKFGDNGAGYDGGFDGLAPTGPVLAAEPTTQDFGTVNLGLKSAAKAIVLASVGSKTTGALAVTLTGGAAFAVDSDGCTGATLASGGACTVSLHFAPAGAGAQSATLSVAAAPGGDVSVSLSGTGAGKGSLEIGPAAQDLGEPVVGSNSAPFPFKVTNSGTATSGAVTLAVTGTDANQFAISSDPCSGQTLAPKASCTVVVAASPTTPGSKAASLTATSAGDPGTATASLSAIALAGATFVVKPLAYDFGSVVQGAPAGTGQTFTVENVGGVASGSPMLAVTGANAEDFALSANTCTGPLAALALSPDGGVTPSTCTFVLGFTPSTAAPETATVTASAPGTASGQATVTGTGLAPAPATLTIAPTTQPLDPVAQGGAGADYPFTVTNSGHVTSGAIAVSMAGTNKSDFALGTDGCTGQTLAPGLSCTVYAHFAPSAASRGAESATVTATASPGGSATVTLGATALAPASLSIAQPAVPEWQNEPVGTTAATYLSLTVTNNGDEPSDTIAYQVTGSEFAIVQPNPCTASLAGGQGCTFQVSYTPLTAGTIQTEALTASSTSGGSAKVSLQATALWVLTVIAANDASPNCQQSYVHGATVSASSGLSCYIVNGASSTCTQLFKDGATVTLSQALAQGSYASFNWFGCNGLYGTPCTFPMTSNVTVTADYCGHSS